MAFILTPIVDPDDINTSWTAGTGNFLGHYDTSEIHINAVDKTFYFKGGGNLASAGSGATGQAVYSFFKDRWQDTAAITKFDFPMLSITNEQFEFIDGWIPDDGATYTFTDLTFADADPDTITHADGIDFRDYYKVGDTITISGGTNDGNVFTVEIVTATVITLDIGDAVTAASNVAGTITSNIVAQTGFDTTTSKIIRTAGWAETNGTVVNKRSSGIVSLGTLVDNTDQPYYAQDNSFTASTTNTEYTGPVNEAVRIFAGVTAAAGEIDFVSTNTILSDGTYRLDVFEVGDVITVTTTTNNNTDYTVAAVVSPYELTTVETVTAETPTTCQLTLDLSSYYAMYVRERGKLYADSDLIDIGVSTQALIDASTSTMTYIVYRFPFSNATDLNLETTADNQIDLVTTTTAALTDVVFSATNTLTVASGLAGFVDGDYIKIKGSSVNDGFYTVNGASSATTLVVNETLSNVDDSGLDIIVTADGVADVSPYEVIDVEYLKNPQTGTGVVNITGDWATGFTYALGDVAYDITGTPNSKSDPDGARWYYVSATTGVSTGANMNADTGNTWTIWEKASGFGERWVNDAYYAFSVIIDANNTVSAGDEKANSPYTHASGGDKENIYDWAQWALRQTDFIDIDATRNGNITNLLAIFVGATLETATGVFIDDLKPVDTNSVKFYDYAGTSRSYPLVVTVTINFNNNLSTDTDAVFYAYYSDPVADMNSGTDESPVGTGTGAGIAGDTVTDATKNYPLNGLVGLTGTITGTTGNLDDGDYVVASNTATEVTFTSLSYTADESSTTNLLVLFSGNEFGTVGATQVVRSPSGNVGSDVTNNVPDGATSSTYQFSYAYDGDTTAGRSVSTDTDITVVSIGLETGQYVQAEGTITNTGATVSLVAPLERNYSNPA